MFALYVEAPAAVSADGQKNGVEVAPQFGQSDILAQSGVELEGRTQGQNGLNFQVDQLSRQPVLRHAQA